MKQFIVALLTCITLGVNAQVVDSTLVINSDVERLVDKYSDKIEATIVSLAETLKQPAEFIYTTMVKQQYVKSYTWLIILILSLITTITGILMGMKLKSESAGQITGVIISIIFGILLIVAIGHLKVITTGIFNPDYGAIKDIADLFK